MDDRQAWLKNPNALYRRALYAEMKCELLNEFYAQNEDEERDQVLEEATSRMTEAQARVQQLEAAITEVVTQRGDDICWMDAYKMLGGLVGIEFVPEMLAKNQMLTNCRLFVESMLAGTPYQPMDPRKAFIEWMNICEHNGRQPSWVDAEHSALLSRLLNGLPALPDPPPLSFSYPWYDLIDNGHSRCEISLWDDPRLLEQYKAEKHVAVINQEVWTLVEEMPEDKSFAVRYIVTHPRVKCNYRVDPMDDNTMLDWRITKMENAGK